MDDGVDNILLLEVLKELRSEMRDQRALLAESLNQARTQERYVETQLLALNLGLKELKDDLELLIKSELMGLVGDLANGGSRSQ